MKTYFKGCSGFQNGLKFIYTDKSQKLEKFIRPFPLKEMLMKEISLS